MSRQVLAECFGCNSERIEIDSGALLQPLYDRIDSSRPVEIDHEVLSARAQVDQVRRSPAEFVKSRERKRDAKIVCDRG